MVDRPGTVAEQFRRELGESPDVVPELLPSHLATICARLLPADGVGLSVLSGELRVPLGTSDEDSAAAERLQVVVGEGPCLQALHDGGEVRADERDLARRWPMFYDELIRQTSFVSVASLPLRVAPNMAGAIDLYFHAPTSAYTVDLARAGAARGSDH